MLFGKNRRLSVCALCWQETVKYTQQQLQHTRARGIIYIHSHAMETNENAKKTHRDDDEDSKEDFREKAGVYASSSAAPTTTTTTTESRANVYSRVRLSGQVRADANSARRKDKRGDDVDRAGEIFARRGRMGSGGERRGSKENIGEVLRRKSDFFFE